MRYIICPCSSNHKSTMPNLVYFKNYTGVYQSPKVSSESLLHMLLSLLINCFYATFFQCNGFSILNRLPYLIQLSAYWSLQTFDTPRDPHWANRNGLWGICSLLDWQLLPNQETMEHLKWHQRPILTELNCTFTALIMKLWRPPISEHPPENAGPWLRKQYAFWCWTKLSNRYRYGPCRVILLLFSQFTGMLTWSKPASAWK